MPRPPTAEDVRGILADTRTVDRPAPVDRPPHLPDFLDNRKRATS